MDQTALDSIELHDAVLLSLNVNYFDRTAVVEIDFYEDQKIRKRTSASIRFHNVKSISHIVDLPQLRDNAAAGNVTNWWPSVDKKTYLYLAGGCLIVEAASVEFERTTRK